MTVLEFITNFARGNLGQKRREGGWSVREDWLGNQVLVHTTKHQGRWLNSEVRIITHLMAYRMKDGTLIGNGNRMDWMRRSWGRQTSGNATNHLQTTIVSLGGTLIPFTLFTEANLPLAYFSWVQKPKPEELLRERSNRHPMERQEWNPSLGNYVTVPAKADLVPMHFSGACIFRVFDRYFLFDIDRQEYEVGHIFNPFIVELPSPAESIETAYELLKPVEVQEAARAGIGIKRQGEFFFLFVEPDKPDVPELTLEEIETIRYPPDREGFLMKRPDFSTQTYLQHGLIPDAYSDAEKEYNEAMAKYLRVRARLRAILDGPVRLDDRGSHKCNHGIILEDGSILCSGVVEHSNREHAPLELEGWWRAVKNTALRSVTIQGDID